MRAHHAHGQRGFPKPWTWPSVKTLRRNQLPKMLHEPYILTGYRPCPSSVQSCLLSVFCRTNETLNFWTHFVPFLVLVYTILQHLLDKSFTSDPFNWPLLVFMMSGSTYLIGSSMAHLFCCCSEVAHIICYFIDYSTVSIYIMGLGIAYNEYVFPEPILNSLVHHLYPVIVFILSISFTAASCETKISRHRLMRVHGRKITFPAYFFWCSMPLLYRAICGSSLSASTTSSSHSPAMSLANTFHIAHGTFSFLATVTYGAHLPEVLAPGWFDFLAASHQLFHLCNVGLTYYQYHALKVEMRIRRDELLSVRGMPTFGGTFGIFLANVCIQLLLIMCLAVWLRKPGQIERIKQRQGLSKTSDALKDN